MKRQLLQNTENPEALSSPYHQDYTDNELEAASKATLFGRPVNKTDSEIVLDPDDDSSLKSSTSSLSFVSDGERACDEEEAPPLRLRRTNCRKVIVSSTGADTTISAAIVGPRTRKHAVLMSITMSHDITVQGLKRTTRLEGQPGRSKSRSMSFPPAQKASATVPAAAFGSSNPRTEPRSFLHIKSKKGGLYRTLRDKGVGSEVALRRQVLYDCLCRVMDTTWYPC